MAQKFLSTKEAAEYFGVTTATIINWEKRNLIPPCLRIGKTRRFLMTDIKEFERRNSTGNATD